MSMSRKTREPPENLQNDLAKRGLRKMADQSGPEGGTEGQVELESTWAAAGSKKA